MKLDEYLPDRAEYSDVADPEDLLPLGQWHDYISTTFLNGWINYVKIRSAWCINRYRTEPGEPEALREAVRKFNEEPSYHTDFGELRDDVLILAKAGKAWWVFWFDQDCSDSSIGRFRTEDPEGHVIRAFEEWVFDTAVNCDAVAYKLDPLAFRGWVKG